MGFDYLRRKRLIIWSSVDFTSKIIAKLQDGTTQKVTVFNFRESIVCQSVSKTEAYYLIHGSRTWH